MRRAWWFMPVTPELWEAEVGGSLEIRSSRPAWPIGGNPISNKIQKLGWAQWFTPVIPTLWEGKVGGSSEVRISRPA